ncbi:DUF4153 domain-containing protein [Actinoplanes sp. CA-015351]|uniref:DUF4153 domain-containing protein n=1 Tax=Actinoplanes sp. CA-015351 TaxID=3239897 RepID=UPI003D98028D
MHGPWPPARRDGVLWPGPGAPASAPTLLALAGAAIVAALTVPLDRPGVGWLVTAIAGTAALIVARIVPGRPGIPPLVQRPQKKGTPDRYVWAVATVALLAVGTIRSADWLFALCVLTGTVTGAIAISSGRSLRAIAVAYLSVPVATVRSLPWISRGLSRVRSSSSGSPVRILGTAVVSIVLLAVFGALFASADAAFARVFEAAIPDIRGDVVARWIFVGGFTFLLLAGAAFLRAAPPSVGKLDRTEGRKVGWLEWAVPLGLLVLLFAAFVAIQLTVLFGGVRYVVETDGLTYAEYARGGFWQLCAVTVLTLVVLAGAARWAPRRTPADRVLLRTVLGSLAALTLVIVASALHRMNVYTDTYGLTRLRLLVACCEAWFGVVLAMVLIAGIRIRAPWLPRVAIAAGVLALLGLAVANPDRMIAENNVSRFERTQRIDMAYLAGLSPDAVPALAEIADEEKRRCLVWAINDRMSPDDWRGWNLGRQTAREILGTSKPGQDCWELIHRP